MIDETFQVPIIKLGAGVQYDAPDDLWCMEVAVPDNLAAANIAGSTLRNLLETDSQDHGVLRILIEQKRQRVERFVAMAELNHWPDKMGVFPVWKEGKQPV